MGQLFAKQMLENYKLYLMSLAVLAGSELMILAIHYLNRAPVALNEQKAEFLGFYYVCGAIFTSSIFSEYGNTRQCTYALMLPASHFEKYFVKWVYTFVLFQAAMFLTFYLVYVPFIEANHFGNKQPEVLNLFELPGYLFLIFALIHAVFFYGAIFFRNKAQFIKTASAALGLLMLLVKMMEYIQRWVLGRPEQGLRFFTKSVENNYYIEVRQIYYQQFGIAAALITVLLWVATYFRLQEKQIR